jgi:protein O-GlcNAc transferase
MGKKPISMDPTPQELKALADLHRDERYADAESSSRTLIHRFPEHGFAHKILGAVLRAQGRLDEALAVCKETAKLRPDDHEAHFNLACELHQQGHLEESASSYLIALKLQPNNAIAYKNLGGVLKTLNLLQDAEMCCRQAIALAPSMAGAHNNLGNVLQAQGRYAQATTSFRNALKLNPNYADAHNNLAVSLKDQGFWDEARTSYENALKIRPDWPTANNNLLYCLSHDVSVDARQLFSEHLAFGARFEAPLRKDWPVHSNTKDPERCLQVGFISGDFFDHALSSFLEPVLPFLSNKPSIALHAYYTQTINDAVTQRLRDHFAHWHAVPNLNDIELAAKIRRDRIDILIDLSGHTAHNRLLTFARKPAPIQASWLGYPGTTGLQAIDYHLHDRFWIPPGELDWQFTEKSALLPAGAVFLPSENAPPIQSLPAQMNGYITFGSFNRVNKLNTSVLVLWAMLLREIPTARLVLGSIPLDSQESLIHCFESEGIERDRISIYPRSSMRDYLDLHHQIDICLDTFPYSGGTTTLHAAWMGVPTLTLAGETPSSRVGASILNQLNIQGFIATSIEDFLSNGCFWAKKVCELAALRMEMRERFQNSAMGQPELFSTSLDSVFRKMWHKWCNDLSPEQIDYQ